MFNVELGMRPIIQHSTFNIQHLIMNKRILQLAVPSIISNITVPLLGLVDVAIVGHIGDAAYIGAIAVGSMLFNVIYWLFGFLRMGTSGMTSQALGRRDLAEVLRLLVRSLSIGVGIGVLFFVLQKWLIGCGLWAMSPEADVVELARRYCYVCIWGAPAVLGLYGFTGWFIGMQNTRIPMMVSLTQNVVNIIASLLLVFVGGMTVEGVALGTVIAQWWGFLMTCLFYRICYRRLSKYDYRRHLFAVEPLKQFFSLNKDIFLRTLCLVAVNLFFTAAGSRESTIVLAVNTLLMTLFTIFSYFMDGFASVFLFRKSTTSRILASSAGAIL
jgi:multidrug resistance protein, MATE family